MGSRLLSVVLFVLVLAGCARDEETALKSRLAAWFYVDDTLYFKSQARCTAAMFRVMSPRTRAILPVQDSVNAAKQAFTSDGLSAFQKPGYSPNDLTDALLLKGRGTMGKQALAAAAQAVPCFEGTKAEGYLREALTRPGGLMAYDRQSEGLMVLDPDMRRLFYVAGDVW